MTSKRTPPDDTTAKTSPPAEPEGPDEWDRAAAWIAKNGALPAIAVLTVVMAFIYVGVFRGEVAGDDLSFHFAETARIADCLRHGDFDFRNPSANGGFASAYYYQVIPQLASALPTAIFGHHLFWFQLSVFIPLVLAPACAYRGMRLVGAQPWQAVFAAFVLAYTIGASRWGFSADGTFSVGLYTQTWAFAALPIAMGHSIRWALEGKGLAPAIAWGAFVGLAHPFAVIALGIALLVAFPAQIAFHHIDLGLATYARRRTSKPDEIRAARAARWPIPARRPFVREFLRLAVFAALLVVALLPILAPLLVDYAGFGGFPHRVNDEVGPGFKELAVWHWKGMILDHQRGTVLTWALPVVLLFGRGAFLRWLWVPAFVFAVLLGLGPHMGKTGDDLLPAVRFLGAMQICFALAIGAGAWSIAKAIWDAPENGLVPRSIGAVFEMVRLKLPWPTLQYGIRTGVAAVIAALAVLVAVPGSQVQHRRVRTLADQHGNNRVDMMKITDALKTQPPGRKQVGPGCENHWWNLLSYVYGRIPALLQMGGGGLQASPNYDFLWTVRDFAKLAWVYDTPYLVFESSKAAGLPVGELVIDTGKYIARRLPTAGIVTPIHITGILPVGPTGANTPTREAALAWLKTEMPLNNRHLAYDGYGPAGGEPKATVLRSWRQDSPGDEADIVAEVDVTEPSTFVIRESWHPRWHAYVDGAEVPVRRVTPDFPAVDVPAGKHVLQMRFERPWWAQLAWLAWPGAAIGAWLVTRWLARRRERERIPEAHVATSTSS